MDWFLPFARQLKRVLKSDGSFVLNLGGREMDAWQHRLAPCIICRLLLALCDDVGFNLCQEFFWYNPAGCRRPRPNG